MNNKILLGTYLLLAFSIFGCKQNEKGKANTSEVAEIVNIEEYEVFGEEFSIEGLLSSQDMIEIYNNMEVGDSLEVSFTSKVHSVCQKKGCWMILDLGDDETQSFVKFKDYDFFVPMDAADADAIIKGVAYKSETSVEELKHYAEDAKKSKEEIAKITKPKVEYTFLADCVYLKK